jgi:hypothetical protein
MNNITDRILMITIILVMILSCEEQPGKSGSPSVTVSVNGNTPSSGYVYACWIEDTSGNTIQHLYVCESVNPSTSSLSGVTLPIWNRPLENNADPSSGGARFEHLADIDAVTGASMQGQFEISREFSFDSSVRQFRILFEVDRSYNDNSYFPDDRPCFLYQTDIINLDSAQNEYDFSFAGWMCNATINTGAGFDQHPGDLNEFPFFDTYDDVPYAFRTERMYIEDDENNINDMLNSITATITPR